MSFTSIGLCAIVALIMITIQPTNTATAVVVAYGALYLVQPTPEKVAVVTTVAASSGPVGWVVAGGVFVVVAVLAFFSWMIYGSADGTNSNDIEYVNENRETTRAAIHSVTAQQKAILLKDALEIKSFHVSCKSDHPSKPNKWNAIGIVLFEYGGKGDFYINGIHCKPGYIVIKTDKNISTGGTTYHAALFKKIFGKSHNNLTKTLVAGGFAVQEGKCVFNSGTFNCGNSNDDKYHFGTRVMNPLIQHYIEITVNNWIKNRKQNTFIKDVNEMKDDVMCLHPEYEGGDE